MCIPNDTVWVVKGGSIICWFSTFTASFQALDLLLWQAAHLQHRTLQATFRTRSGSTVFQNAIWIWRWEKCPRLQNYHSIKWHSWGQCFLKKTQKEKIYLKGFWSFPRFLSFLSLKVWMSWDSFEPSTIGRFSLPLVDPSQREWRVGSHHLARQWWQVRLYRKEIL